MKRVRRFVALLILILLVVVVGSLLLIDRIGRKAVEIGGEQALGVPTSLESLSLRPLKGEGGIEGLKVSNPEGFATPHFVHLREGSMALDLPTLLKDTVIVQSLRLDGLDLNLEKSRDGANYEVILENMKRGEESAPKAEEAGKQFTVRELVVRDIDVHADVSALGQKVTRVDLHIDEIRLENVGSETEAGVVMSELTGTVVKAVLVAVLEKGAGVLPGAIRDGLGTGLKGLRGVGKLGVKVIGNVSASAGGKVLDLAGGAAKGVLKGIGGVLGGEEDK